MIEIHENDIENAQKSAEKALSVSESGGIKDQQIDAFRVLGILNVTIGNFEDAETFLYNSNELAQQLSDRFSEAKARYELGVLFLKLCENDSSNKLKYTQQAKISLDSAIEIFEALGAIPDLDRAKSARNLIPVIDKKDDFSRREAGLEQQAAILRNRLNLPEGGWYQAAIFSAVLLPRQGADDEGVHERFQRGDQAFTGRIFRFCRGMGNGCRTLSGLIGKKAPPDSP